MADDKAKISDTPKGCSEQEEADSLYEKEFRRQNTRRSFRGQLYSAIGTAAFIGVLGTLVNLSLGTATLAAGFTLGTGLLIGGFVAVGVISLYLAQREWTELKCIQDDRLARHNAQALEHKPEITVTQAKDNTVKVSVDPAPERKFTNTIQPKGPLAALIGGKSQSFAEAAEASRADCNTCHSK